MSANAENTLWDFFGSQALFRQSSGNGLGWRVPLQSRTTTSGQSSRAILVKCQTYD